MSEVEPFVSRFPTRIHRLEVKGAGGEVVRTIDLVAPVDPDVLLDDPVTHARYAADNYLPYWPIIWPSGLMMATRILLGEGAPPGLPERGGRCIDLGCGLGTAGIAAGLRGWEVLFTDYDPEAVVFAEHNAKKNGVAAEKIRAMHMDWRSPVEEEFEWVIASDVLYERRLHALLLRAIDKLLKGDGVAWVSDPERTAAADFPLAAVGEGWKVTVVNMEGESFSGGRQGGQLYILRR